MSENTSGAVASNAELGLLARLKSLKVLLGTDSPEVRGWAPAVRQSAEATANAAITGLKQADQRGDDATKRAHKLEEALEFLFLAIVTRADSDYLSRAVNRADEALRFSMPGWTPPVPMTEWADKTKA